ncbi:MAG: DEAD/DEAH box helicase [Verrucomicrobiia bacterium]
MLSPSPLTEWFRRSFTKPTPAQAAAWPKIQNGKNVLIVSPTGTGKTLAAFLGVLNDLALLHERGALRETIYAVYVSPLRALGYDLEKNLNGPLRQSFSGEPPIRVALRIGDTTSAERQRQFARPPHVLLTTPESLCVLMTQPKWLPHLATVRWVIVDEIHALAESKRGSHLSISLERLEELAGGRPNRGAEGSRRALQRIGLSATVAPLEEVADFLAGASHECEIVDTTGAKRIDLRVYSPLGKAPYPVSGYTGQRLIRELARLVRAHRTTLVFTNTRSGAEAATYWLREALPEIADQVECHHASLDRDVRQEVEDRLKRGELRAVVCSTSLELGIDIGSIDVVVMLSTPKGVSRALQRTGRSGHNIHAVSRGLLMATNMNDLVECCATAVLARTRHLDAIRIPEAPLDILAQHLASMGCTRRWTRAEAFALVRRAYPYRNLGLAEFNDVLDYLAGGGKSLRNQYADVFGKIALDDDAFETRAGLVRRDLLQNIGVIPNEGVVRVMLKGRNLGVVEETFIRQLQQGDVFTLSGRPVRVERIGVMECFVSRADGAIPTVPRWNANKMPLSNKVAQEIVAFRSELKARLRSAEPDNDQSVIAWIAARLACGRTNAEIIFRMSAAQARLSEIPAADCLLIEEYLTGADELEMVKTHVRGRSTRKSGRPAAPARHYFFHSLIGRAANDALSRVVALRLARLRGGNAVATPDDYGFILTVSASQVITRTDLPILLAPDSFDGDLDEALARSHLLKHHFRNAAQSGLMVYRNYFGAQKSVRKLQWSTEVIFNVLQQHEPDHVLLREARRDAVHTYIDAGRALEYLEENRGKDARMIRVDHVPPLSFAMFATKIKEALLVEDPREMMERLFHLWWQRTEGA